MAVVASMPKGDGGDTDVYFFRVKKETTPQEVELEYESRGLVPCPLAQIQVNINRYSEFYSNFPNISLFKIDGNWCYVLFEQQCGVPTLEIDVFDPCRFLLGRHWFAGVSKKQK